MDKRIRIIGKSPQIKELLRFIEEVAKIDDNVLILGETGVGKELAAKMIHFKSKRKDKPLIKLNCANLNENLLESELFGYKKGAYTGAYTEKPGLIEEANNGTFFLDEIGDITPSLQAKLLAVIEDKELRRLGESNTRKIDVRFIFATNKDIYKLMSMGTFRKDLFYRISSLTFCISPLRERKEDIPLLVYSILKEESLKRSLKLSITKESISKLLGYSFPGNVRELENLLVKASLFSEQNSIKENNIILPKIIRKNINRKKSRFLISDIINALVTTQGNISKASKELNISRGYLHSILKKLKNLDITAFQD